MKRKIRNYKIIFLQIYSFVFFFFFFGEKGKRIFITESNPIRIHHQNHWVALPPKHQCQQMKLLFLLGHGQVCYPVFLLHNKKIIIKKKKKN